MIGLDYITPKIISNFYRKNYFIGLVDACTREPLASVSLYFNQISAEMRVLNIARWQVLINLFLVNHG